MGNTMSQPLSGGDIKKTQSKRRLFDHVFHTVRGLFDDYIPLSFNLLQLSPLFFAMLGDTDLIFGI
jgi:hypothetical protein